MGGMSNSNQGKPMRVNMKTIGQAALGILGLFVIAVFLQWIGLTNWPTPANTLYSYIANAVG
jgi:hypothetical protein